MQITASSAAPGLVAEHRRRNKEFLIPLLAIILLLAISFESTIIPTTILRQYAWRTTLVLLVVASALIWLNFPMKVSSRIWLRVMICAVIVGGAYLALILAEAVNAVHSGSSPLTVRIAFFRLFTIVPAIVTVFVAGGGGKDVEKGLRALLRPYFFLSLTIAVGGILSWALIHYELINWQDWLPPAELSDKIERKGGADLYTLPLYLGFVLVGTGDHDLLGAFRISGWSPEPNSAALFVTPALFMIPLVFKGKKWLSVFAYASIIGFDFFAFSVTNLLGLLVVGGLFALRYLLVGRKWQSIPYMIVIISLAGLFISLFGGMVFQSGRADFIRVKAFDSVSANSTENFHRSIADTNSMLGRGIFRDPNNELGRNLKVGLISTVTFWAQAIILAGAGCLLFLSKKPTYPIGLALVYVVFHSMKDPVHVLSWPIYIFVIAITILALAAPRERVRQQSDT